MIDLGFKTVIVARGSPIRRRFAGDITLSRGRYSSVCNDELGNDQGTVVRELLAITSPSQVETLLFTIS